MLRELSFLGLPQSQTTVRPHTIFLSITPRVSVRRAGPSLVAGVDTPPRAWCQRVGFTAWVQRCNPSRSDILLSRRGQRDSCSVEYAMEKPDSFWAGCPCSGCSSFASLQDAKGHCESLTGCGGITAVGLNFQVHLGSNPSPSQMRENVAGCAVVGRDSRGATRMACTTCSDSRQQHILQFCGPVGRTAQVPALADMISVRPRRDRSRHQLISTAPLEFVIGGGTILVCACCSHP